MTEANARDIEYPGDAVAGERVWRGELRWSVSWHDADTPVEEDGIGVAPTRVRVMLLAQHGEWRVRVDEPAARTDVMRVLRSTFGLSLGQASAATTSMPGEIYRGTRGEATLLSERLASAGLSATAIVT
jgi:hypothetical protein